jgi:hypothetical protein
MAKTGPFDAHPDRYDDWFDRHEAALAVGRSPPRFAKGKMNRISPLFAPNLDLFST